MAPPQDFSEQPVGVKPEEDEETPQGVSKRHFWSKPKVQDKPTRAQDKAFKALLKQGRP